MIMKKKHYVFFDSAYQGFASDNYHDDTWSLKTLASRYVRCQLAQSFSKNFGLYGERTGTLSIVCTNTEEKNIIQTKFKEACLPVYSNPPIHGARIVDLILSNKELTEQWEGEVKFMSNRLRQLRIDIV